MIKVHTFIKEYFFLICLFGVICRIIAIGASIGDALALLSICAIWGWLQFLHKKDDSWKTSIINHINELKLEISSLKINQNVRKINEPRPKQEKRYF